MDHLFEKFSSKNKHYDPVFYGGAPMAAAADLP